MAKFKNVLLVSAATIGAVFMILPGTASAAEPQSTVQACVNPLTCFDW